MLKLSNLGYIHFTTKIELQMKNRVIAYKVDFCIVPPLNEMSCCLEKLK